MVQYEMTTIKKAITDNEINNCYAVMSQLRPHILQQEFAPLVKTQMQSGYHLAYVESEGMPVACTGFRYSQNLAWGKFIYVDDLITDDRQRSKGYGKQLLDWLIDQAKANTCSQLHLDSGVQRLDAHRFYERESVDKTGYHFAVVL